MDESKQIFISYIGELDHSPPADIFLVECDADYIRACLKLSASDELSSEISLWVRSKNHFTWLKNFTDQINCTANFSEKTPRLVLSELWNVQIPNWLTDADVLNQELLNIEIETENGRKDFNDRLLEKFLGPTFQQDIFNVDNLVDVIKVLCSKEAQSDIKKYPVLQHSLKSKCEIWEENSSEGWIKNVCSRISRDIDEMWQCLSFWTCLYGYPEKLLEYVLAPEQVLFVKDIPVELVYGLPLKPTTREQIQSQIKLLFKEIQDQVTSSQEFQKVLYWTSGLLFQEYQFISTILKSHQFSPTQEDVSLTRVKFKYCPGVSESNLNSLIYVVAQSQPQLLDSDKNWDGAEWIRWITKEYTPYRTWQIHNKHYDADLEKTVARFSKWFVEEYANIHKDPDHSLIHCLSDLSSNESEDQLSIILLIDCLPLEFMELLDVALKNEGYSRHGLQYRFAALPTITEFNKPLLISGKGSQTTANYNAILKTRTQEEWGNRKVFYLSNLKSLTEMTTPQDSSVILLNFLDGDELLHEDVESKGTTYDDELNRLFSRVASSLKSFTDGWIGSKQGINIHVVTDHGACLILDEEKQTFDSTIVKKLFPDGKFRFAAVNEKQAKEIPDNLWALGHQFKQPFVEDDRVFYLPSGHNTVKQSGQSKGYVHGGVTPEEVIVPTAIYKLIKTTWLPPATRFLNLNLPKKTGRAKFYIQRMVPIVIEIQNPNSVELSISQAIIVSPETDINSSDAVVVSPGDVGTIKLNCYFKKMALGENELEIEIAYEIFGESHTMTIVLDCEFKSAISGGFNLREL